MQPTPIAVGQRLTDFTGVDVTVERVASGGFGLVAFGPDRLNRGEWTALKTLRPGLLSASARARDLFIREALTWVGLWPHANLLNAQSVTQIGGQPFLILDYAAGGSLRENLARPPSLELRLTWAQCIAAGLLALHTPDPGFLRPQPVVHRDLKPENVLIFGTGHAQITDFGLAKVVADVVAADPSALAFLAPEATGPLELSGPAIRTQPYQTQRGAALGTLAYMAPEQWADAASAGPPADLYAFGLILSELLAGRHALLDLDRQHSAAQWRTAHLTGIPRPLRERDAALPASVEHLYQSLLAKHPQRRPTAAEALAALQATASQLGQEPYQPPDVYPRTPEHQLAKWHNWAIVYFNFGYFPEALARNDRAYALDPRHADVLLTRGNILSQMGQVDDALQAYAAAEAALPAGDRWNRSTLSNMRGAVLSTAGRYAEADAAFARSLEFESGKATAWANRALNAWRWGYADARSGHTAEARAHVSQGLDHIAHAIALDPNNPSFLQLQAQLQQVLAQLGG